jgi:hypothetical protein
MIETIGTIVVGMAIVLSVLLGVVLHKCKILKEEKKDLYNAYFQEKQLEKSELDEKEKK